jgi:hypothetical protein
MVNNYKKLLILVVACFVVSSVASAGTIVSRLGDPNGTEIPVGEDVFGDLDQILAVSWNQTFASLNMAVEAYNVRNLGADPMQITFELRSGTADGVVVDLSPGDPASVTLTVGTGLTIGTLPLFAGGSLGPGTYFLVASAESYIGAWLQGDVLSDFAAAGAAFGPEQLSSLGTGGVFQDFTLGVGFAVMGDVAAGAVPEPATSLLIGAGLLLAGGLLRRRRKV